MSDETATLLIVEDDPVFRRVMSFTLERSGFTVESVSDGLAGLERLRTGGINLLITDQQMPRCTGLELLRLKQADPSISAVPAILCTAKGFELDSVQVQREFDLLALIHKPFSPRKLAMLIRRSFVEPIDLVGCLAP